MQALKEGYVTYILLGNNPTFYFTGYTDRNGDEKILDDGKDRNGNVKAKNFTFKGKHMHVPKQKTKVIKFIDEAPFTKGSPNLRGRPIIMKLDLAGDAKKRVDNRKGSVVAQAKALELKGEDLARVALICGTTDSDESIQLEAVMTYASANPDAFMELVDEDNLQHVEYRALVKGCMMRGVIKRKGAAYLWEGQSMGTTEEEMVKTLMGDEDLYTHLKEAHDNLLKSQSKKKGK